MASAANDARVELLRRLRTTQEIVFGADSPAGEKNCSPMWSSTRGYVTIDPPYCASESDFCTGASFTTQAYSPDKSTLKLKPNDTSTIVLVGFTTRTINALNIEGIDQLRLEFDAKGLTGKGTATIRRQCVGSPDLVYDLPVTLGPDRTRPVVEFYPCSPLAPYAVSWGDFRVTSNEQLLNFDANAEFESLVGLVNYDDPTQVTATIPHSWFWPSIACSNPAEVAGTRQRIFLKSSPVDLFRNPAVADPSPITFVDDSLLSDVFDFDVMEPKGLVGQARYVAPGTDNSPCESGGCIVLGPVTPCGSELLPTFFSFRISATNHVNIKLHAALFTDGASGGGGRAIQIDSIGCIWGNLYPDLGFEPTSNADPTLAYSTGFVEQTIITQSVGAAGAALGFDCDGGTDSAQYVWVIERVELMPDPVQLL